MEVPVFHVRVKTPLISMAGLDLWPRYETKVSLSWRRESHGVQGIELRARDSSDHSAVTLASYAPRSLRRCRKQKADWIRQDAFHLSRMGEDGDARLINLMYLWLSFAAFRSFEKRNLKLSDNHFWNILLNLAIHLPGIRQWLELSVVSKNIFPFF